MQDNFGKCHLILSTDEPEEMQVGESLTKSTNCKKLLDKKIHSKLTFDTHIKTLCKNASNKLKALDRVISYMTNEKKTL